MITRLLPPYVTKFEDRVSDAWNGNYTDAVVGCINEEGVAVKVKVVWHRDSSTVDGEVSPERRRGWCCQKTERCC